MLNSSTFLGPIFEGFLAAEIVKYQINSGRPKQLYYFRDQQGLEIDFILPTGNRKLLLIEAKASRTIVPEMAEQLQRLMKAIPNYSVKSLIVHRPSKYEPAFAALRPGISAVPVDLLINKVLSES